MPRIINYICDDCEEEVSRKDAQVRIVSFVGLQSKKVFHSVRVGTHCPGCAKDRAQAARSKTGRAKLAA